MDYKKLYYDIINDQYKGNDPIILENLNELKVLFKRCSKTLINEKAFSFGYVKECIYFLRYLKPDEKALINDDFLSFFRTLDKDTFELIKFIFYPDKFIYNAYSDSDCNKYIKKIIALNKGYYNINFTSNYLPLVNLNEAINYYNLRCNNPNYYDKVIDLLFVYGLKYNNYEYLYNYLDDPEYYYDKFISNDVLSDNEKRYNALYYSSTISLINKNIPELFSKNKIIIR